MTNRPYYRLVVSHEWSQHCFVITWYFFLNATDTKWLDNEWHIWEVFTSVGILIMETRQSCNTSDRWDVSVGIIQRQSDSPHPLMYLVLEINSLWPSDALLQHKFGSTLAGIMVFCLITWANVDISSIKFGGTHLRNELSRHRQYSKLERAHFCTECALVQVRA